MLAKLPKNQSPQKLGDKPFMLIPHAGLTGFLGVMGMFVGFVYAGAGGSILVVAWALNNIFYLEKRGKAQAAIPPANPAPTPGISPAPTPDPVDDYTQTIDTPVHTPESAPADLWVEPGPVGGPGLVTRGSAVPVAADRVIDYTGQVHPLSNVIMPRTEIITAPSNADGMNWDLVGHLAENLKSTLIIGVPGAGKGMLMSNMIRRIRTRYPELKIVGIDPKNDPKETGYWADGFDQVFRANNENMSDRDFVEWMKGCIDKFRMMPDGKVLIWDEFTISCRKWSGFDKAAFREITNYIVSVGSGGDSRFNYIIAVGQISNAEDMGMSAGVRDIFKSVGIVSNEDRSKVDAFMRTAFTPNPPGGPEAIYRIMDKSPVGRAIFCWNRGQWEPMPRLENLSGYDRDTRQHVGEPLAEPRQLTMAVDPTPTPAPPVTPVPEPGFSVDDLMGLAPAPSTTEFVDKTAIPALRVAMQTRPDVEMFIDIINWLKSLAADGEEIFNLTQAAQAGWNKKAKDRGWLKGRSGDEAKIHLDKLTSPKYRLLAPESDGRSYRITLR